MTVVQLYPPIAAAMLVMAVWFGVAYHFHRGSQPGDEPWYFLVWLFIPFPGLLAFLYLQGKAPITSTAGVFPVAVIGIGLGGLLAYLLRAIITRDFDDRRMMFRQVVFLVLAASALFGSMLLH